MRGIKCIVVTLLVCGIAGGAYPRERIENFWDLDADTSFKLIVGEVLALEAQKPKRVSVRDPDVVEVKDVSGNTIVVAGMASGFTEVTIWDSMGESVYEITVLAEDLDRLQKKLKNLIHTQMGIPGVYLKKNEMSSKIILQGKVTEQQKEEVEKVVEPFKDKVDNLLEVKVENNLVQVDVQVLEVSKNAIDELGFNWQDAVTATEEPISQGTFSEVMRIVEWSRTALSIKLNMLISEGKGRVLARPKLVCLSGKEARFLVGGEVPVISVTKGSESLTSGVDVEYREYGVILTIRPEISEGNKIKTLLTTEVSSIAKYWQVEGSVIPEFAKRHAQTELYLKSGQTVFIAGLLKDEVAKDLTEKIPFFGDIPILGALFRSKEFQQNQTELVISLTPRVVGLDQEDIEEQEMTSRVSPRQRVFSHPATAALGVSSSADDPLTKYIRLIQRRISSSIHYPQQAQDQGWEGEVTLNLHLNGQGKLLSVFIAESSGYTSFDEEATSVAHYSAPYPPFPSQLEMDELWVEVPVSFKLY